MTHIQRMFVFSLSASAAAGGMYGSYVGINRASTAAQTVAQRHKHDPAPLPLGRKLAEIAAETWSPTVTAWTPDGMGLDMPVPDALRARDPVRDYDPAMMAELKREGIELSSINEIRTMMRIALTSGDSVQKLKMALELKRKFNLEASRDMLSKIERVGPDAPRASLTEKGKIFVKGVVDSMYGVWDRVIGEVDR